MIIKRLSYFLSLLLLLGSFAFAQNEDLGPTVDYKVHKMQKVLNLTDSQAEAVRPIIKDYLIKRGAILDETAGEGIVDHVAVKDTLKGLKDNEYQKLGKILSEDQMKKWIDKENLMASLNPDSAESRVDDDGPTLGADGANFKF